MSIDSASYVQVLELDEKERHCGMDCYEKTWAEPKFCVYFPYEMGIRILMITLVLVFMVENIIFIMRYECVGDINKFDHDW